MLKPEIHLDSNFNSLPKIHRTLCPSHLPQIDAKKYAIKYILTRHHTTATTYISWISCDGMPMVMMDMVKAV